MRLIMLIAALSVACSLSAQLAFCSQECNQKALPFISSSTFAFASASAASETIDTVHSLPNDKDGDGIADSLDQCPDEKGVAEYNGCPIPDSDEDSVSDDLDNCPLVKGLVKNHGCPPGDRDGDKVDDDEDKCPDTPGAARFNGCPFLDTDGDGVNDDDDKCIDVPGSVNNFGCPESKESRKDAKKEKDKKKKE